MNRAPPTTDSRVIVAPVASAGFVARVVIPPGPAAVVVPPCPPQRTLSKKSSPATTVYPRGQSDGTPGVPSATRAETATLALARTTPGMPDVLSKSWETHAFSRAGSQNVMAPARAIGPATVPRAVRSEFGKLHIRSSPKIKGPMLLRRPVFVFIFSGVRSVSTTRYRVDCSSSDWALAASTTRRTHLLLRKLFR